VPEKVGVLTICTHKQAARLPGRRGKHRGKQSRAVGRAWGGRGRSGRGEGTRLKCLGSSDGSQSSCLLASPFPPPIPCRSCVRPPARPPAASLPASPRLVSLFCSRRTHRCGTSIVLKSFHLLSRASPAALAFVARYS